MKAIINYNDNRWKKYKIDFQKIINSAVGSMRKDSEVSIILTNDSEIRELNKKYRGKDSATNVLSFETGDDILLGDIYISFDTVERESRELRFESRDTPKSKLFIDHATHMVVHGILHLLGYDHQNDTDADVMESKEIEILKKLGIGNPYINSKEQIANSKYTRKNKLLFALCSLLFGGVTALGFAPFNLWWMSLLGIGGMYYLTTLLSDNKEQIANSKERLKPKTNLLFGFAYAVASFWWVVNSIYVVPELAQQFAIWTVPALVGIGIAGALVFSIPFIGIRNQSIGIRPFVFSATWTTILWLREWLLTGFPWNPIANITMPFPILSNSMSLWGALGLTFVIVGLIAAIVEIIKGKSRKYKGKSIPLIIFSVLLIVGCIAGYHNIHKSAIGNQPPASAGVTAIIRIVQPAQSATQKATHNREEAVVRAEDNIRQLVELAKGISHSASGISDIDLIIFPETAYPYMIVDEQIPFTDQFDVPVVIGAMSYQNGKIYNSMVLARDGFVEHIYSKSHLVPFGEYRPFGDIVPTPGQLTAGNGPEVITVNRAQLTEHSEQSTERISFVPAICYEIIFTDSLIPDAEELIPDAIINITNDTWFGKTPGTYQHLDMVRRYAIESGLPIVRANYSGISAFVGADGTVISSLPVGVAGTLDGTVSGAHMTLYRAMGRDWWMVMILVFSAVVSIVLTKCKKT